ncbi:MAG: YbjQ family protein [Planctomycetota bacterium]
MIALILQLGIPIILILVGLFSGTILERLHFKRLDQREADHRGFPVTDIRTPTAGTTPTDGTLVIGQVVIASDYFKTFIASFRKIIGGEVRTFERLMDRARREAHCRMVDQARALGATDVINVRFETSSIGRMTKNPMPMVEVLAYGTAVKRSTAHAA